MDAEVSIFQFNDYRSWLAAAFASRIERNSQLSVSSLATKVGMSQSLLSLILRGKRKLTFTRASAVADYLEMNTQERSYMNLLIQLESTLEVHSRNAILRELEGFAQASPEARQTLSFGESFSRVIQSNPTQIALAKDALKNFAQELEKILTHGDRTSVVNVSLAIN